MADWAVWVLSDAACVFWGLIGTSSAALIPSLLKAEKKSNIASYIWILGVCLAAYVLAWSLRRKPVMRVRRGLVVSILCHATVTVITTVVAAFRQKFPFVCQCLLAISVMAWFHIALPVFDYGLLQFFLRLPLQTLAAEFGSKFTNSYLWAAILVSFGTISSLIVVSKFEGGQQAAEQEDAPADMEAQHQAQVNTEDSQLAPANLEEEEEEEVKGPHQHLS